MCSTAIAGRLLRVTCATWTIRTRRKYNPADVVEFGGADYLAAINRAADKYRIISEMCDWAKENRIYSFNKLVDYARANELEWFMALG